MANSIYRIASDGNQTLVAVGADGLILVSFDSGVWWSTVSSGTTNHLYGVAYGNVLGVAKWVIVGQAGIILSSSNGASWAVQSSFTASDLYAVAFGGVFLAVGVGGVLGLSDDLGSTWEAKPSGTTEFLHSVTCDYGAYLIVGDNDTVITGSLNTLQKEILVNEYIFLEPVLVAVGSFHHVFSDNIEVVSGYAGVHKDGVTLGETYFGGPQYIYCDENLFALDLLEDPLTSAHLTVEELFSVIAFSPAEHANLTGGNLLLPLLSVAAQLHVGGLLTGTIALPPLRVAGALLRETFGEITLPPLSVVGTMGGDAAFAGNLTLPLLRINGALYAPSSADYATWLVNTNTKVHGTYTNYPLLGMGRFNGEWIGLFPDGLYRLEGDDDALTAIATKLYWAPSDLGTTKQKRIDAVYVNCRTEGNLRIIAWTDEQQKRVYTKDCTLYPTGMTRKRQTLTRGLSGQSWQFGIENCDGAKLTVDDIEVVTIPEQRRVK